MATKTVSVKIISPVGVSIRYTITDKYEGSMTLAIGKSVTELSKSAEFTLGAKAISDDGNIYIYGKAGDRDAIIAGDAINIDAHGTFGVFNTVDDRLPIGFAIYAMDEGEHGWIREFKANEFNSAVKKVEEKSSSSSSVNDPSSSPSETEKKGDSSSK